MNGISRPLPLEMVGFAAPGTDATILGCHARSLLIADFLARGLPLTAVRAALEQALGFVHRAGCDYIEALLQAQRSLVCWLIDGQPTTRSPLPQRDCITSRPIRGCLALCEGIGAFFAGDTSAVEGLRSAREMAEDHSPHRVDSGALFLALATARSVCSKPERLPALQTLAEVIGDLGHGADAESDAVSSKRAMLLGECARLRGDPLSALLGYETAAKRAFLGGLLHEQALAWELAGRVSRDVGLSADGYFGKAVAAYRCWGAQFVADRLAAEVGVPANGASNGLVATQTQWDGNSSPLARRPRGDVAKTMAEPRLVATVPEHCEPENRRVASGGGGYLAASITHEINQPLSAISAYVAASLRWLQRDVPDVAKAVRGLQQAQGSVKRAADIVQALRSLAGRTPPQHIALHIDDLVADAVQAASQNAAECAVVLESSLSFGNSVIEGDPVQIRQLIGNLIGNAIEAIAGAGGGGKVAVASIRDGRDVAISISDSGPGIPADVVEHVFEPLFSTKPRGMGMGLAICQSIIHAHRGTIEMTSTASGARFVVWLPASG